MDKRGIAWKFVLGLVIASLLMIVGCKAVANFINFFDTGPQKSFQEFSDVLSEVAQGKSGTLESLVVKTHKKGGIVGFNGEPYVIFQKKLGFGASGYYIFVKPLECGEYASCICRCEEIFDFSSKNDKFKEYFGEEYLAQLDAAGVYDVKGTGSWDACVPGGKKSIECVPGPVLGRTFRECNDVTDEFCLDGSTNGGFAIFQKVSHPGTLKGVHLENYKGVVGVCYDDVCFSKEDKVRVDFQVFFKQMLVGCVSELRCDSPVGLLDSILSDGTGKIVLNKVSVNTDVVSERVTSHSLSAYRFALEDDVGAEVSYLVMNPEGFSGPFREKNFLMSIIINKRVFPFDEFSSLLQDELRLYMVLLDPVTGTPTSEKVDVDKFELFRKDDSDELLTFKHTPSGLFNDEEYWLVNVGNGNEYLYAPFPEGEEPKPPFPIVFYVKEKT